MWNIMLSQIVGSHIHQSISFINDTWCKYLQNTKIHIVGIMWCKTEDDSVVFTYMNTCNTYVSYKMFFCGRRTIIHKSLCLCESFSLLSKRSIQITTTQKNLCMCFRIIVEISHFCFRPNFNNFLRNSF